MINIAILGFGTVGSGVYQVLKENNTAITAATGDTLNIRYILDLRSFEGHEYADRVTGDYERILSDDSVRVIVETMGGENPAYEYTLRALRAGKSVVTSNKLVVEKHGSEFERVAAEHHVSYLYEASVGGGIPILHPLVNCLAANRITRVCGILNGTTNFILERMEKDAMPFTEALALAQKLGYAEKDPTADISGADSARKICILASLAFGKYVGMEHLALIKGIADVTLDQITEAAAKNYRIKLIGCAERDGEKLRLYVAPCLVQTGSMLAATSGVFNAVSVTGNMVGEVVFYGQGAGSLATASAVVSDVMEAVRFRPDPVLKESLSPDDLIVPDKLFAKSIAIGNVLYPVL